MKIISLERNNSRYKKLHGKSFWRTSFKDVKKLKNVPGKTSPDRAVNLLI